MISPEPLLILASKSPRRRELLNSIGVKFEVEPAHIDETLQNEHTPEEIVIRLCEEKSRVVAARYPEHFVLAADTIVVLRDRAAGFHVLNQPADDEESRQMLAQLSGRTHEVFTGFCLRRKSDDVCQTRVVQTVVQFKKLSTREIEAYVASGEGRDKAGSYGAQGIGAMLIERIDGSYTNVVGLPLTEVADVLEQYQLWDPAALAFVQTHHGSGDHQRTSGGVTHDNDF